MVRNNTVITFLTFGSKVVKSIEFFALAGPMAHDVIFKLNHQGCIATICFFSVMHWEHRFKDGFEPTNIALCVQEIHLHKFIIAFLLNINEIGDRDQRRNFGEVLSLAIDILLNAHEWVAPRTDRERSGVPRF